MKKEKTKSEKREDKRRFKMAVSGKSVFKVKEIIDLKSKTVKKNKKSSKKGFF